MAADVLRNDRFLRALRREPTDTTPIWVMRQAGRYLPEYRATRSKAGSFMGLATNPEYACEVTLQPLARFDLDAAILFSDILTIPDAMGLGLSFAQGEGPRFEHPLRLLLIHNGQGEAYVNQNVISNPSLGGVVQADFLADAAKIHLATAQAKVLLLNNARNFSGDRQTHAITSTFERSSENSLAERNSAIVRRYLMMSDHAEATLFEQRAGPHGQVRILKNASTQDNIPHVCRICHCANPIGEGVMELRGDAGQIETRFPIRQESLDQRGPITDAVLILDLVAFICADASDGALQADCCLSFEAILIGHPGQISHGIEQASNA